MPCMLLQNYAIPPVHRPKFGPAGSMLRAYIEYGNIVYGWHGYPVGITYEYSLVVFTACLGDMRDS